MLSSVVLLVREHFLTTWFVVFVVQTPTCPSCRLFDFVRIFGFRISDFLVRCCVRSFVPSFLRLFCVGSFLRSSVRPFVRPSVRSSVRPSVCSFVARCRFVALCCALSRCSLHGPSTASTSAPRLRRQTTAMTSSPRCCGVSSMRAHRLRWHPYLTTTVIA